jgi:hypothetical protein
MVVEALRSDFSDGPTRPELQRCAFYKCPHCSITYLYFVDAAPGEWDDHEATLPSHFDLLCGVIEKGHLSGHRDPILRTDGEQVFAPSHLSLDIVA